MRSTTNIRRWVWTAMTAAATATPAMIAGAQAGTLDCSAMGAAALPTTCTRQNTVSGTMPTITRVNLSVGSTTLTGPVATDFDAADSSIVTTSAGATITVSSNRAVTLQAAGAAWTTPSGTKSIADLRVRAGSSGAFQALTSSGVNVVGTPSGSAAGRRVFPMDYQSRWNLSDVAGSYSMVVTYNLTAP